MPQTCGEKRLSFSFRGLDVSSGYWPPHAPGTSSAKIPVESVLKKKLYCRIGLVQSPYITIVQDLFDFCGKEPLGELWSPSGSLVQIRKDLVYVL